MKNLLLSAYILYASICIGQSTESRTENKETPTVQSQRTDTTKTDKTEQESLSSKINEMSKELSKKVEINQAAFCLAHPINHVHKAQKRREDCDVTVKSITIITFGGRIQKVIVAIKDDAGYYTNKGPISVTTLKSFKHTPLYYEGSTEKYEESTLNIGELINYIDFTNRASYPSDYTIVLSEDKVVDSIKISKSPLDFFDVRAYSDAKGLSGEANGLAQTDINVSFIGNTKTGSRSFWSYVTPLAHVNMNLTLSKFDSDFDTLAITSFITRSDIDVLKYIQYSNVAFKVETELFRYSRIHDGFLCLGHQMYSTVLRDTSDVSKRVLTPGFYLTLGGTMFNLPKIRGTYKFPVLFNYLHDQPFSGQLQNFYMAIVPEIEIVVDPVQKGAEGNEGMTLFGRIRYFDLPNYKGNNFWQLQLGATIPLTEVLK